MTGAEFMANKWWNLGGSWFWGPSSVLFHLQPNFLTPRSLNQNTLSCMRSRWVPPVHQVANLTEFSPWFTSTQASVDLPCQPKKSRKRPRLGCQHWQWHLWNLSKVLIFSALPSGHLPIEINHCDKMWFSVVSIPLSPFIFTDGIERTCIIHVHVRLS